MVEKPEAVGCTVAVLVPQVQSPAMLWSECMAGGSVSSLDLPTVELAPEPDARAIVRSLGQHLGGPVTLLRSNAVAWDAGFDATAMVVEIEPIAWPPPDGFCWRVADELDVDAIRPDWARPSVLTWAAERSAGWSDLRPQWSRPGWLVDASAWMVAQMTDSGYVEPEAPQIHQLWGVSVVLSASSRNGKAFLKCSGDRFRGEALVTTALARCSPGLLPETLAVEPERGWLLMRDMGAPLLGDQPEPAWGHGLDVLADLQLEWLGRTDELIALGAQDRPLDSLAAWVDGAQDDVDLMGRLTPPDRASWFAASPRLVDSCRALDLLGPGLSLVHGDLHPWNVVADARGARIFDWTDAAMGHPFLDLVTYVMRTTDVSIRRGLLACYLDRWAPYIDEADLQAGGQLALVVGALYQAHTYAQLIPTVMPDDLGPLRGGDTQWLQRALRRLEQGLEGTY